MISHRVSNSICTNCGYKLHMNCDQHLRTVQQCIIFKRKLCHQPYSLHGDKWTKQTCHEQMLMAMLLGCDIENLIIAVQL